MSRKGAELSTETKELIFTPSESVQNKTKRTVKNVEHSKNDYHERSKEVPKDWHSGDFGAKWQKQELHRVIINSFVSVNSSAPFRLRKPCKGCCLRRGIKEG